MNIAEEVEMPTCKHVQCGLYRETADPKKTIIRICPTVGPNFQALANSKGPVLKTLALHPIPTNSKLTPNDVCLFELCSEYISLTGLPQPTELNIHVKGDTFVCAGHNPSTFNNVDYRKRILAKYGPPKRDAVRTATQTANSTAFMHKFGFPPPVSLYVYSLNLLGLPLKENQTHDPAMIDALVKVGLGKRAAE